MPLLSTFGGLTAQTFGGKIAIGGSAFFDTQGDVLFTSPGVPFAYGTGDFTIEMWFYPTSFSGGRILWHQGGQSTTTRSTNIFGVTTTTFTDRRYLTLYLNGAGQASMEIFGNSAYRTTSNTAILNRWNHVALVRSGGNVRIFLNGNPTAAAALGSNFSDVSVYTPCIGRFSYTTAQGFVGYITNVRVAKSAYYSTIFDPSRTPFTRNSQGASSVQLLLNHLNSSRFLTDSSINNIAITNSGTFFNTLSPYNSPYTPFGPVTTVSAVVTPSTTTLNEGSTLTVTVAGTNTTNGTYYYTIEQPVPDLDGADFSSGSLSGTFTITSNSGSFTITPVKDLTTDGDSTFAVYVRSGSVTGPIIGTSVEINLIDSSLAPEFTVTPTSIDEGSSGTFTVANIGPDGTYFWTILNGSTASADFPAVSGSFSVTGSTGGLDNGTGNISVATSSDRTTEGAQTFQLQIRSGSTSGPVIITSASVTINDTSLTPAFTVTPASISEGSSGTFTVNNLGPAGTYFWTILNGTTNNADFTATSGSFTTSTLNGSGSFSVTPAFDYTTDSGETFQVQVREGSISGTILITSSSVIIGDTSTTVTATPSPTLIAEGGSTTISVSATALPTGTYFWTILNGTTTNADFVASSGSFNVFLNSGSFTVTAVSSDGVEPDETFQVQIRTGSTSGTVIATTSAITITTSVMTEVVSNTNILSFTPTTVTQQPSGYSAVPYLQFNSSNYTVDTYFEFPISPGTWDPNNWVLEAVFRVPTLSTATGWTQGHSIVSYGTNSGALPSSQRIGLENFRNPLSQNTLSMYENNGTNGGGSNEYTFTTGNWIYFKTWEDVNFIGSGIFLHDLTTGTDIVRATGTPNYFYFSSTPTKVTLGGNPSNPSLRAMNVDIAFVRLRRNAAANKGFPTMPFVFPAATPSADDVFFLINKGP